MDVKKRLAEGSLRYMDSPDRERRLETAENGQHPYAIVICCSDSRVIPERIFDAGIGELFVIRVAGNVLDNHQLGSVEYAAEHLHCGHIVVLGHTGCGAVAAALGDGGDGYIRSITDVIRAAAGSERDPDRACRLNAEYAVDRLKREFASRPELGEPVIEGAVYDIRSGAVSWL